MTERSGDPRIERLRRRLRDAEVEVERLTRVNAEDRAARRREAVALRAERDGLRAAITEALRWHVYSAPMPDEDGNAVRIEKVDTILREALSAVRAETKGERCGRLLVGQGGDTWDPNCVLPAGHGGRCRAETEGER